MARKRLQQSTADYLAIAISPALIMLLVGSLVFFLQEISYEGQFEGRIRWMLGWFVFATVLIARIGIEFGKAHASMYAGALALACTAFTFRFLEEYILGMIVLMGIIWWCVNKLTWDCTVIDDSAKVTSAGLLQQSGMETPPEEETDEEPVETEKQRRRRLRREELLGIKDNDEKEKPPEPDPAEVASTSEKAQSPGVSVVYFSLAALPLFGIGQAFLPSEDGVIREGFIFLWVYVASALGLLLTTSFLGLRRYLRQRRIQMPTSITAAWIGSGVVILLLVLGLSLLIPRPHARTSVTALLDRLSENQTASDVALSSDDAGAGEGRRAGRVDEDSDDPGNKTSEEGEPTDEQGEGKRSGESDQKGKSQDGEQDSDENQQNNQQTESNNDQQQDDRNSEKNEPSGEEQNGEKNDDNSSRNNSSPSESPLSKMPQLIGIIKWILYAVFGLLILWALLKNRHDLAAGAREFLQSIANFWANLFGGRPKKRRPSEEAEEEPKTIGSSLKSFAEYDNPFRTGQAERMSPDALVLYTEEAFRAFARELGIETGEEMTPAEIGREVVARFPELSESIRFLTTVHSRILYSSRPPLSFEIAPLEQLWNGMSQREPQAVG